MRYKKSRLAMTQSQLHVLICIARTALAAAMDQKSFPFPAPGAGNQSTQHTGDE
jgi:hypothetical protein